MNAEQLNEGHKRVVELTNQYKPSEAAEILITMVNARPEHQDLHANLAVLLFRLGMTAGAFAHACAAIELYPKQARAWNTLGCCLRNMRKYDEAKKAFWKAIRYKTDYIAPRWNNIITDLQKGDMSALINAAQYLYKLEGHTQSSYSVIGGKPWGGGSLENKTILIHLDQGAGDFIMFSRFVWRLKKTHPLARVLFLVPEDLESLFISASLGVFQTFGSTSLLPPYDYQCLLYGLPSFLGVREPNDVMQRQYLTIDSPEQEPSSFLKVGICWQGNPTHENDASRSLPLQKFARLMTLGGVQIYSLQVGSGVEQITPELGSLVVEDSRKIKTFLDTAMAIQRMDVVITIDSAVAHLAGAMGMKTFLLLPYAADWRWFDRVAFPTKTPWYDSVTLFRQPCTGDWESVMKDVEQRITWEAKQHAALSKS